MREFGEFAAQMARSGSTKSDIVRAFQAQMKIKTVRYYDNLKGLKSFKEVFSSMNIAPSAGSKAEIIFYEMLTKSGIVFKFQYKIGPYTADYLVCGYLIVELDGPKHNKAHDDSRDRYMRGKGYRILRVPLFVLVSCPEAVIDEIKEATKIRRVK